MRVVMASKINRTDEGPGTADVAEAGGRIPPRARPESRPDVRDSRAQSGMAMRGPSKLPRMPRSTDAASWLSPKEAAAHLGIGVDTIYDACAERGLRHVKLGHSTIRIRREWLDAWAETFVR
jgi:excisionase family DNA binding protein